MTVRFVNRKKEIIRIKKALKLDKSCLVILYGRRRCGKSTLLKNILSGEDLYFVADTRDKQLQINSFARHIETFIPGFSRMTYSDWESLLVNLNNVLKTHITVCLDEFPYLVKQAPELPSVLQKIIDNNWNNMFHIILCGSSQQMMYDMTFESCAPLFGRAAEVLHIKPMIVGSVMEYFNCDEIKAIEEYAIWGGIPRYWELRKSLPTLTEAIKYHLLDPYGILYEEPERLFSDELRTSTLAFSILNLIGSGCNRLSEIAGRLNKPATQLSRPIQVLINLAYIKREIPFGESEKSSKRGIYKISDPLMKFYFTYVAPNKTLLQLGHAEEILRQFEKSGNLYLSEIWENLSRDAIPFLPAIPFRFKEGKRWWGTGVNGKPMEIDVVAESADASTILIGEAEWSNKSKDYNKLIAELNNKSENFPLKEHKSIIKAIFTKTSFKVDNDILAFTPKEIVKALTF